MAEPTKLTGKNTDLWVVAGVACFLAAGAFCAYAFGQKGAHPLDTLPPSGTVIHGAAIDGSDDLARKKAEAKAEADKQATGTVAIPPLSTDAANPSGIPTPVGTKGAVPYNSTKSTALVPPPKDDGVYQFVTFDVLSSYLYELPDPDVPDPVPAVKGMERPKDQIPPLVHALNGKKVAVQGFMLPFTMDKEGKAKSFLLLRNQNWCCNGQQMMVNEWIKVKMKENQRARVIQDVPLTAYGTLTVGEELQNGYVVSIYRMDADRVDEP